MSQPEVSSQAVQPPSLVLVAPMPRRPIALVNRRHHHHHHHYSSSCSHTRSRSSRTVSSSGSKSSSQSAEESKDSIQLEIGSTATSAATMRMVGHPYSRPKTPNSINSLSNPTSPGLVGWPLGLAFSTVTVSPPPRSSTTSRDGLGSRPLSRLSQRTSSMSLTCTQDSARSDSFVSESVVESAVESDANALVVGVGIGGSAKQRQLADKPLKADDEPMLASPRTSPTIGTRLCITADVERTPTKSNVRVCHIIRPSNSSLGTGTRNADDQDQEPRSTPTIGAASPRPEDIVQSLTVSPTSPCEQRMAASAAVAAAQLSLCWPRSPSADEADSMDQEAEPQVNPRQVDALLASASASVAPSPCLSESLSRSPSASPSPCPSPASDSLVDASHEPKYLELSSRKMALPLPPLPTSPIPRNMTRNPFERYLGADDARERGCMLHARLTVAMAQNDKQCRSLDQADADHEMGVRVDAWSRTWNMDLA
ncbi:uncharacterized protein UMAG_06302 [Mycosarcoma maydis]|uniref:Uncharacterized protein n=1 Tax=Mycosarcoma maydis TaxID=5270 RepID=A0A0D1E237_MYCMD|nr:uncharacterized protein UMAG_06302 [Ustilago maydis 521]KIS70214.1 hypothetical protein UMAG_06302 [Ustilago maydis 521]|eukprot:XP_011388303.1 hypothetical protein UMAG_06302 [Ustilago maydis 521]